MTGIIKCSFNCCHYQSGIDVFLGFEGFDGLTKLFYNAITRKPKGMLSQKSKN